MAEEQQARVVPVEPQALAPHRGTLILILGILGIVCCFICGIIAWVMGNGDLREMAAGRMDPSGEGLTKAGKICGMISVMLQIIGFVVCLLIVILSIFWESGNSTSVRFQ